MATIDRTTEHFKEFEKEWLKNHDGSTKGMVMVYAGQVKRFGPAFIVEKEPEPEIVPDVVWGIIPAGGGYVVREYNIVGNDIISQTDGVKKSKNFALQEIQLANVKRALGK